jgi:zinc transporter ZupT
MNQTSSSSSPSSEVSTPWGPSMGAALVVQMATLCGVVIVAISTIYRKWYAKENDSARFLHLIWTLQHLVVPSFAAGALLATTVFLIIPEAFSLLQSSGHEGEEAVPSADDDNADHRLWSRQLGEIVARSLLDGNATDHSEEGSYHAHGSKENEVAWKFGAAVLGGFIFPILLGALLPEPEVLLEQLDSAATATGAAPEKNEKSLRCRGREEATDVEVPEDPNVSDDGTPQPTLVSNATVPSSTNSGFVEPEPNSSSTKAIPMVVKTKNLSLAAGILVGDFFHNLADGFFIGTAFLLCSKSIGWTIVATTIYHEVVQEVADYILLTAHCGLTPFKALLLNFISGCSVMVGVVIILSIHLEDPVIGVILSVSSGVYLYIAVGECIPRVQDVLREPNVARVEKLRRTLTFFVFFTLGAVPIGLVLLSHGHCETR